jgi:hypothetical protein
MRLLAILLLAAAAAAADPVGLWRFGVGTVDGQPARTGTVVLTGQSVVAADTAPMRLICHEAPGITAILAAGSQGRFAIEQRADGGRELVLELARGAVQVDVADRSPYAAVRVRGAAMDVRVTGTLFVVERPRQDADYIAMVRGRVQVGLRPEVARATGRSGEIELLERQGLSADTANGLGQPTALSARPQIALAAGLRAAIADQAAGLGDQGTPWDIDLAAELTGALIDPLWLGGGDGADGGAGLPLGSAPPAITPFAAVAEDLVDSLTELGSPPQPVGDDVTAGPAGPAGPAALPLPPSPP